MSSKSPVRSCEDADEATLSYAEVKALCAGNPLIKEKMDLDVAVTKLKVSKANHVNQQYRLEDQVLKHFPEAIRKTETRIKGYESDSVHLKSVNSKLTDKFSPMVILGKEYTEKETAGAALIEACKHIKSSETLELGSYKGFDMALSYDSFAHEYHLELQRDMTYTATLGRDELGNITRVNNALSYESERLTIGKLFHNARLKRGKGYFATKEERRFGISRLKNETEDIVCLVSNTLARLYCSNEHIGKGIKQIRKELALKLEPQIEAIKKKYNLTKSGTAGAKALIEIIKALDNQESANPTGIPFGTVDTLVNMAIGSPAICAFRMLKNNEEQAKKLAKAVFVSLFNKAESSAILDLMYGSKEDDSYYEAVFRYCVDGNLQAMLDEYAHILDESGENLANSIIEAFSDTASLQVDTLESFTGTEKDKARMRTHFAVGYFNARISDENVQRTEKVRKAFNSPFRPFVLSTTSIGQEGLDFHFYCRKIMHWNLPSNPIDLEQREGRINRYKCLAVRQNIASKYQHEATWEAMFEKAVQTEKGSFSDLVPYWCLTESESATVKIERIVPMYPMSQDRVKYTRLIKILSLYRLTLGQPRQEELIELLDKEISNVDSNELFFDLSPYNKM